MGAPWYDLVADNWKKQVGAVLFITAAAALGKFSGLTLLLFPELGALAHGVIARPNHPWAQDLRRLIATPTITGVVGMLTMRYLGSGPWQVLLVLVASLSVIALMRSIVFPALSAGILPLVLGLSDWIYPACIFASCFALALVAYALRAGNWETTNLAKRWNIAEDWETHRLLVYLSFMTLIASSAYFLSRPLLLFPPLAVLAFEALVRTERCAWIGRPLALVSLFIFASAGGYAVFWLLGVSPLSAMFAMIIAIACMTWLNLYAAPAIAVAILPYATVEASWLYPIDVGVSVAVLAIVFRISSLRTSRSL